uniref:Uncharacterized protein n=1 Tax=Caenorhabditis japonica TaxID=281687 RepID=A0A8R1IS62_CAEJA
MKTVRLNKQALAIFFACFLFLFCLISYFSTPPSASSPDTLVARHHIRPEPVAVRDVKNRIVPPVVERREPVEKVQRQVVGMENGDENLKSARVQVRPPAQEVEEKEEEKVAVGKPPTGAEGLDNLIGKIHYENSKDENATIAK